MLTRFDAELIKVFRSLFVGIAVKTLGYLMLGAGIFMSFLLDKNLGYNIVIAGATMVIAGWIMIYRALRKSAKIG
jgi:ABC-type antimicrobial peptide transport system permease subunit